MGTHFTIYLKKNDNPSIFIERAAEVVKKESGVIAYPTDTVYGMGADPLNIQAVKKIFEIKGRDFDQGLPVLVADIEEAKKVAILNDLELKLAENFWPGKLTMILRLKTKNNSEISNDNIYLDKLVTGGKDTIALRVPQNPIILGICKKLKEISNFGGIIGTSANFSGDPSPTTGDEVVEQFRYIFNFIIHAGPCQDKIPSTIIIIDNEKFEKENDLENSIIILREGKITKSDLLNVLK